jgi:ABC-2 type transport system ATP-binding protein
MIRIQNITKFYGLKQALKNVSFEVNEGEILGLLGRNGAGKTTLMRIMTGNFPASSGLIYVGEHEIHAQPTEIKKILGYLPEHPPLYNDLLVEEYLIFVARLKGVEEESVRDQVDWAMNVTQITDRSRTLIAHLSKGYRQRVGLAGALVNNPKLLILDEPLVGLDPVQSAEMKERILDIGKGRTIIFSSHILSEVEELCQKVVILEAGELIAQGTTQEIRNRFAQSEAFHVRISNEKDKTKAIEILAKINGVKKVYNKHAELVIIDAQTGTENLLKTIVQSLTDNKIDFSELGKDELDLSKVFQRIAGKETISAHALN